MVTLDEKGTTMKIRMFSMALAIVATSIQVGGTVAF